jgi:hypothetical protein
METRMTEQLNEPEEPTQLQIYARRIEELDAVVAGSIIVVAEVKERMRALVAQLNAETIDKFIKQKFVLSVRQHADGRVQADLVKETENHHAQGPTVDMALRRLEEYLAALEAPPR